MKKHISKRLLSVILAVVLVFASVPFGSATTAFAAATDDQIAALKAQITAYTQKMNGSVYNNMRTAYQKYIAAYKLYDAAYYGNNNVSATSVTTATSELQTAIANMTQWSAATVTSPTYNYGNSVPVYDEQTRTGYARNIVYSSTPTTAGGYEKEGFMFKFIIPQNVVFLYDGGELRAPVMLAAHNNGGWMGNTRYPLGFLVNQNIDKSTDDSPYFHFAMVWQGHHEITKSGGPSSASDWDWSAAISRESEDSIPGYDYASFQTITADNRGQKQEANNGNKWWEFANYIRYFGANEAWSNNLQDIKFSFTGASMRDTTVWTTSDNDYHYYFEGSNGSNANFHCRYYIIDYSEVASTIGSAAVDYLNFNYQAAQYKPDGTIRRPESVDHYYLAGEIDALLGYIEALQADPTTGFTSSNYATRASTVAKDIHDNIAAINAISSIDEQTLGYQTLREKMYMTDDNDATKDNARVTFNTGNSNPQIWTAATWNPFSTNYTNAKTMFDNVASGSYNATDSASAATLAGQVETTYKALKKLANFTPIDDAITAIHNKCQAHKNDDTNFRYTKTVIDALKAELADTTKYPYLHKTAAERVTYDYQSDAAIAAEAATIAALADSMLDLNDQINVETLLQSVANAKAIVNTADPDAYTGIDEAIAALDAYNNNSFITNVSVPGTCVVAAISPEVSLYDDQAALDEELAPFLELQPRTYTITLNDEPFSYGAYGTNIPYGTYVTIDSPSGESVDWEYSFESQTSSSSVDSVVSDQSSFDFIVKGNTTIYTKGRSKYNTIAITYMSSLGKVYAVEYVPVNAEVNPLDQGHPNYVGYRFTNYDTETFTATENTTIVAEYEPTSVGNYVINFVNAANDKLSAPGTNANPSNNASLTIPYNTRLEFSADMFTDIQEEEYYDEDQDMDVVQYYLAFNEGGKFKKEDDYTQLSAPQVSKIPSTVKAEDYYDDLEAAWADDNALYAISMVPSENYEAWRYQRNVNPGRGQAVTLDENDMKVYNTNAAPNTEKLLVVGEDLDHVWYAQQDCYLVFYTREEFEDAIKANVFEGIPTNADPDAVVASYTYAIREDNIVTDVNNGTQNKIIFRGSNAIIPDNADAVEMGTILKIAKNPNDGGAAVEEAQLKLQNVANDPTMYRTKSKEDKITRLQYNTGHQFATNLITSTTKYPAGTVLYYKYVVYTNYRIPGSDVLYTAYSEPVFGSHTF